MITSKQDTVWLPHSRGRRLFSGGKFPEVSDGRAAGCGDLFSSQTLSELKSESPHFSTFVLNSSACCFTEGGNSCFRLPMVPTRLIFFTCKAVAGFRGVKKLSVVMFLPFPRNGSARLSTTLSPTSQLALHVSSFPRYRDPFSMYLESAANHNLMLNLSGLFPIYWVNFQRAFVFWMNRSQVVHTRANLSSCRHTHRFLHHFIKLDAVSLSAMCLVYVHDSNAGRHSSCRQV